MKVPKEKSKLKYKIIDKKNGYSDIDWHKKYFNVGDKIKWRGCLSDQLKTGRITKIKCNQFGRISYEVGKEFIFIEEIIRAI